jgi:sterol desaturase/sphingolipid hydroxylase (fatty acid hydroxylase superfamily)
MSTTPARPAAEVATTADARRGAGSTSLAAEAVTFSRRAAPRIEAAAVVVLLAARAGVGAWGPGDALVLAVLVAVQPFFEWSFHLLVLHYRPVVIGGRVLDFELARRHRLHHAEPADTDLVFVPVRSLLWAMASSTALAFLVLPPPTALTALAGGAVLLLAYEWTHHLIHSRYRPRSRALRALWRAHRLHHYKNERYWFGVTNPAADLVLGTSPDPANVPTSPTARDLAAR